jgi:anti-sigma B factor antagonist
MMAAGGKKPLRVQVDDEQSAAVVHVCGSAGMGEADAIRMELDQLVGRKVPIIVIELSEMDFICSEGLGAMIDAHHRSREHDGQVRLVGPQPAVLHLLEMTNLTKLFTVFATIDDAVTA